MWMVPVSDEVRPIRKRGNIGRKLSRSIPRQSVLIDNPDLTHLPQPRRFSRQLVIGGIPGRGALGFVPCDRIAQQEIGGLQGVFSPLRQRLGQIVELAVVPRYAVLVRQPRPLASRAPKSPNRHPPT